MFVSQPFAALPSQFAKPVRHVGTQAPAVHAVVPCRLVHPAPQVPQFATLDWVSTSQPLAACPSQFAKPGLHVPSVQTPATQLSLALASVQSALHPPQSVRVLMLRSHPLSGFPSQLANPEAHVGTQTPAVHVVVP